MNNIDKREFARARGSDTARATTWGLLATVALIGGIFIGSRGLRDFDPALVSYAGATLFAAFGLAYRFSMWLRRPPTRLYWYRGWQIFTTRGSLGKNLAHLFQIFMSNFVFQRFIERRSHMRWTAHWFLPGDVCWLEQSHFPCHSAGFTSKRRRVPRKSIEPFSSEFRLGNFRYIH